MKKILIGIIILHVLFNIAAFAPSEHEFAVLTYYYDTDKIEDIILTDGAVSDGKYIWVLQSFEERIYKYWLNGTYAGFYNVYSQDADIAPGAGGGQIIEVAIETQEAESVPPLFHQLDFNSFLDKIREYLEKSPYIFVIICFVLGIFIFIFLDKRERIK